MIEKLAEIRKRHKMRTDARKISGYKKGGGKYAGHKYTKKKPSDSGDEGGHGNTRLPYGIAKSEGIDTTGLTPREVWDKLKGEGYDPKEEYKKLGGGKSEEKTGYENHDTKDLYDEYDGVASKKVNIKEAEERVKVISSHIEKLEESIKNISDMRDWYNSLKRGQWKTFAEGSPELARYKTCKKFMDYIKKYTNEDPKTFGLDLREKEIEKDRQDLEYWENRLKEGKENSERYEKLKREIDRRYPTIDSCLKDKNAAKALDMKIGADGLFASESGISYGIERAERNGDKFTESGMKVVAHSVKAVKKMIEKYPKLKGVLGPPIVDTLGFGTYASSHLDISVQLGSAYFRDEGAIKKTLSSDEASGFHPPGASKDVASVIIHEYGHQLDYALKRTMMKAKVPMSGVTFPSTFIARKAMDKFGIKTDDELCRNVSRYAEKGLTKYSYAERHMEFMAECWSEYLTSENPREISRFVGEEIEKMIEEYM